MKHLAIIALFLSTTTACGSSTTVVNREPIGNAGNPGIEETGGSAGSIGQAGSETGGNVGTGSVPGTGGTGNNPGTGGSTTGGNNGTGGTTVNPAEYVLNPTCGLTNDSAICISWYVEYPINLLCADPTNYPTAVPGTDGTNHYTVYPSDPTNKTISCIQIPYAEPTLICCTKVGQKVYIIEISKYTLFPDVSCIVDSKINCKFSAVL